MIIKFEKGFFERAKAGGVTAVNHTVTNVEMGFSAGALAVNECRRWIEANADRAVLATSVGHIEGAKAEGKVAVILGPQNAKIIEENLGYLDIFYDLGLRIMQLTYQHRNFVGNGCGERSDGGLSNFGLDVVNRMNELGIVIDLSHCGWKTTADAIEASDDPVICSHSHPYALTPHPRNKSDDLIRALADKGGVIGISSFAPICALVPGQGPSIPDVITHIDYVANLVGIDHVGLGSDINERSTPESRARSQDLYPELRYIYPLDVGGGRSFDVEQCHAEGLSSIESFPEITKLLVARGYCDADILKVLGGNFLRLFEQVWDRAERVA